MRRWGRTHPITLGFVLLFVYITIVGGLGWHKIQAEARERRDQNCRSFESAHKQEIDSLNFTYRYLEGTPRADWDSTQKFVYLFSLPQLEREAASDTDQAGANVPLYCDDPGVGLPEPDPIVPHRPKHLTP